MTEWRERAVKGTYEAMKDNSSIMALINAVYNGMAPDTADPIYSIVRRRTAGGKQHYFNEDYPIIDPSISILTYGTEQGEQISMDLTHATDVIDDQMEARTISHDGLEFTLLGVPDGPDNPNETSGDSNLIFTRLTYRYQIQ